jgi:hypothetical protein
LTERGCATCAYLCGSLSRGGGLWGGGGAAQNVRKRPRDHRRDRVRGLGRGDRRGRFRDGRRGARVGRHSAEGYYVGTSRRGCLRVVPPTPGSGWRCHWRGSNFDASAKGSGSSGRRARAHGPCSAGLFWRLGAIDEVPSRGVFLERRVFRSSAKRVDRAGFANSGSTTRGRFVPGAAWKNNLARTARAQPRARGEPRRGPVASGAFASVLSSRARGARESSRGVTENPPRRNPRGASRGCGGGSAGARISSRLVLETTRRAR